MDAEAKKKLNEFLKEFDIFDTFSHEFRQDGTLHVYVKDGRYVSVPEPKLNVKVHANKEILAIRKRSYIVH